MTDSCGVHLDTTALDCGLLWRYSGMCIAEEKACNPIAGPHLTEQAQTALDTMPLTEAQTV
jgi:hypothetical protein